MATTPSDVAWSIEQSGQAFGCREEAEEFETHAALTGSVNPMEERIVGCVAEAFGRP